MAIQASMIGFGTVWFILWTVLSFYAHYFARWTIRAGPGLEDKAGMWLTTAVLTFVQLLMGSVILKIFSFLLARDLIPGLHDPVQQHTKLNGQVSESTEEAEPCATSLYLAHATATLATNASIAFVNTGSAFTIKAFEPISTAVLTSMLLGTKLQNHLIIALPLVVSGAIGFVWKPSFQQGATFGLGMAFVSNVLFGVRNINLKLFHKDNVTMASKLDLLTRMSAVAALALLPVILILAFISPHHIQLLDAFVSGCFHITYTIISTCIILKYTSTVGHATCNLLKRILVAGIFYSIGKDMISSSNWFMGAVLLIGLIVYIWPTYLPFRGGNSSLSLIAVVSVVVILVAVMPPQTAIPSSGVEDSDGCVQLPALDLQGVLAERENSMQQSLDASAQGTAVKAHEKPEQANLMSIKMETTNDLIQEAYRVHQDVFSHIIGKYKRAILVNVFQWFNKGDHLITIGQRRILQRMGVELIYHCYYPGTKCNFTGMASQYDPEMVVLIQGAGYIGHPAHEYVVTSTLETFPKNRVMVFPISVCHPIAPCNHIQEFAEIFSHHPDTHVVLRDRYSYDLAEQYFKTTQNYLAPDSAFAVGSIRMNIVPIYDIIWLKRDDWESQKDPMPEIPPNISVEIKDWSDDWMKQEGKDFWEDHQLRTMTGISYLARAKVVVSDRLHAHIMSQLMGKLNVVINSETKKQEHYYMTWEQSITTSSLVNTNAEALAEAIRLLKQYDQSVTLV